MIAVAARFRLISPMPLLMNRRGNDLHRCQYNMVCGIEKEILNLNAKATIAVSTLVPFSL